LERDEHIAEWVRLTEEKGKLAQLAPVSPKGGRGNEGGINAAVRELGIDRTQAQRAVKIAGISDEAKAAAREAGVDNNQSALLITANGLSFFVLLAFGSCNAGDRRVSGRACRGLFFQQPYSGIIRKLVRRYPARVALRRQTDNGRMSVRRGFLSFWA
jgi:ParB family chromosome partitioning protein